MLDEDYFCSEKQQLSTATTVTFKEELGQVLLGRSIHICGKKSAIMAESNSELEQIRAYKPETKIEPSPREVPIGRSGIFEIEMLVDEFEEAGEEYSPHFTLIEDVINGIKRSNVGMASQVRVTSKFRSAIDERHK